MMRISIAFNSSESAHTLPHYFVGTQILLKTKWKCVRLGVCVCVVACDPEFTLLLHQMSLDKT